MIKKYTFSTGGGPDGDGKDDLDSGDEADGKKIDTEEVRSKFHSAQWCVFNELSPYISIQSTQSGL